MLGRIQRLAFELRHRRVSVLRVHWGLQFFRKYNMLYFLEAPMDAVNYSDLRRNLKSYLDQVYEDREALIVTRKNNENVVLISLEEYNSLVETSYLLSSEANARHLSESMRRARAGEATERELIEE